MLAVCTGKNGQNRRKAGRRNSGDDRDKPPVLSSGKRTEAKWGLRQKGELYAAHDRRRIREMILQNSGRSFESCRSMNQELTFQTLQMEMQKRSLEIGSPQMRTLKLIGEDDLYTNLALLLSDQCETDDKGCTFSGDG